MWPKRSNAALWEEMQRLRTEFIGLKAEHDDLFLKHERLRGAFYQARAGLAANGDPIPLKQAQGETKDQFRARKLATLRGQQGLTEET